MKSMTRIIHKKYLNLCLYNCNNKQNISRSAVIADMSLDILAGVKVFTIKHMPEEDVQVRIGCNTGPCCAGTLIEDKIKIIFHKRKCTMLTDDLFGSPIICFAPLI